MNEPDKICDRIGIISAGRLIKIGTPDELKHGINEVSVVEVDTPNLSREQLQRLIQKLNVKSYRKLKYENSKLLIISDRNDNLAEEVATALVDVSAKIRSINTKIPSLEETFIALTGDEEATDRFLEVAQK
jgi:ABC-type multidrug transport system ATPase subunit